MHSTLTTSWTASAARCASAQLCCCQLACLQLADLTSSFQHDKQPTPSCLAPAALCCTRQTCTRSMGPCASLLAADTVVLHGRGTWSTIWAAQVRSTMQLAALKACGCTSEYATERSLSNACCVHESQLRTLTVSPLNTSAGQPMRS